MPSRNIVSWNAMITAYVQDNQIDEALRLFKQMPVKDSISWTTMINGYIHRGKLEEARKLLDQMPHKSVTAQTAMISGYVKKGRMHEAHQIFNQIDVPDVVCWNTMIVGYAHSGRIDQAISLFDRMDKKDLVTWNTMISGFAQIGQMEKAVKVFEEMREKNAVSWNSLITGFLQNGMCSDALKTFKLMLQETTKPDHSTFTCVVTACANIADIYVGEQIHNAIVKMGFVNDLFVGNALISMYAKVGKVVEAELFFNGMKMTNIISWNSMVNGYAINGFGAEALKLFERMTVKGARPDQITFIGVLSACSHAGLVERGLQLFKEMNELYEIEPLVEHYACVVDMLGRAGKLLEAFETVKGMKVAPSSGVWCSFLASCHMHNNSQLGQIAAEKLLDLEPQGTSSYVLLSKLNAESGMWVNKENLRSLMKRSGMVKQAGCSWAQVKN